MLDRPVAARSLSFVQVLSSCRSPKLRLSELYEEEDRETKRGRMKKATPYKSITDSISQRNSWSRRKFSSSAAAAIANEQRNGPRHRRRRRSRRRRRLGFREALFRGRSDKTHVHALTRSFAGSVCSGKMRAARRRLI